MSADLATEPVIHAHRVRRIHGAVTDARGVTDVQLLVPRGSIFGLVGPSGAGKTTTVRLVLGVYPPDDGDLAVFGRPPSDFTDAERRRIGYLPQLSLLYPQLSLRHNLQFVASLYGMPWRARWWPGLPGSRRARSRIRQVLDMVELGDHQRTRLARASGGEQRRLALAAAMVHDAELLVLDEPTAGVDPVLRDADAAVSDINDHILEQVVRDAQERTDELGSSLTEARDRLRALRSAFSEDDVAGMQRVAADLADRLEQTADTVGRAGAFLGRMVPTTRLSEIESSLRETAQQLERLSEVNAVATIDEASTTLDELDATVTLIRELDPAVVVRPFEADVVRATPVAITLDRFYAPGLIALMLQHVAVIFGALALVREREQGTVELFRVAPVSSGERLVGKGVAFVALGAVVAAALTVLVVLAFGVPVPVDWAAYTALVLLTLVASLGYGYVIAGIARTDTQAVQYAMLLLLAAIFFSGLLMPLNRIAAPARVVSWLLPATYAFTGFQELMLLGKRVTPDLFLGLGVIAVVLLAASRLLVPRRDALG